MSSKLNELTDSSPSVPPPSDFCGSGILSWLALPWSMASSGHFDPGQTYDGYKAVEVLDPPCIECLAKEKDCFQHFNPKSSKCHFRFVGKKPFHCPGSEASNIRRYLWRKKDGPFGKEFPAPDATSGNSDCEPSRGMWQDGTMLEGRPIHSSSAVPISRIKTEEVVKRMRRIVDSPPDPDSEGSDELDGEEAEVVNNLVGQNSRTLPPQPPAKRFQSFLIPSTPQNFQPTLASIPTSLPHSSPSSYQTRPSMNPAVSPSPIKQSRASPIVTSKQPQPEVSSSRRREELSTLPFPAAQVFQQRDCWLIRVTGEHPNMVSKSQDSVARLFNRVDRNSREVIMYASYRTIPSTASEEMAANFSLYEDEFINDSQRAFDHMGRDN
ncbi:hypothetical protein O181_032353 [Austropuccinia psidii MF-1]|uniref:Uncharacterized protein n=1 Tax=Austropuccinia psidii MF-1 TaxID=1389203 RepID=A0A9Q3H5F4_9BASI|nr:hypothetical protein [Austropuccinia psidii MF-1]